MQINTRVITYLNYSYIPISLKIEHDNDNNDDIENEAVMDKCMHYSLNSIQLLKV